MLYIPTRHSSLPPAKEVFLWIIILMFKSDGGIYF